MSAVNRVGSARGAVPAAKARSPSSKARCRLARYLARKTIASALTGNRNDTRPRIHRLRSRDKAPLVTTQWTCRCCHPHSQYPERRNDACPGLLHVPPASWLDSSRRPSPKTGRRRGVRHRSKRKATEDSGVDAVTGFRRDEDRGARASESGRSSESHFLTRHTARP